MGTSAGLPTQQRNVSGLVIKRRNSKYWCLVDCGEGTQHQLLRTPYSLAKLRTIFITHVHGDHCFGLPGLLASATMAGRTEALTIVGPADIESFVHNSMQLTDTRMNYPLVFVDVENMGEHNVAHDFNVQAIPLSHRVPSHAYHFTEVSQVPRLDGEGLERAGLAPGPEWGRLVAGENITLDDGRVLRAEDYLLAPERPSRIVVGGDNDTPQCLHPMADGADVLVHEATYTQAVADKVGPAPMHSSAQSVAQYAQTAGIRNLVLTHFSARYHRAKPAATGSVCELADEARAHFAGPLYLASDFDHFELNSDGELHCRSIRAPSVK